LRLGIISDTYGLLREEVEAYLSDSDLIIHAGDIGKLEVLERLGEYSEVKAVRGNIDKDDWAAEIPETEAFEVFGKYV